MAGDSKDTRGLLAHPRVETTFRAPPAARRSSCTPLAATQLVSSGAALIKVCSRCIQDCSAVANFWLVPFCEACAALHYNFEPSASNLLTWNKAATSIRTHSLSESTRTKYEAIIKKRSWPILTPFQALEYVENTKSTKASLKQALAAATKFHLTREWVKPPFNEQIVQSAIQAAMRRPVQTPAGPKQCNVFTNSEIRAMFNKLAPSFSCTYARDAAILAVQLFGARRASEVLSLQLSDLVKVGNDYRIRIRRSKTDQRGDGHFLVLPHDTALGINPSVALHHYIQQCERKDLAPESFIFTTFNQFAKKYTEKQLSLQDWNARLQSIQVAAGLPIRTSHALRATAISLSSQENVHTVAQVGAWKSMVYLTTYHRTPLKSQTAALAQIGSRVIDASAEAGVFNSDIVASR